MPFIAVASADARQIRAGALGAELERVVVDELAGDRVVPIALGLGAQRPDHLRVAVVAALAHVDVAARELERRVRLDARCRLASVASERYSGTISTSPPTLMTSDDQRPPARRRFFSMVS